MSFLFLPEYKGCLWNINIISRYLVKALILRAYLRGINLRMIDLGHIDFLQIRSAYLANATHFSSRISIDESRLSRHYRVGLVGGAWVIVRGSNACFSKFPDPFSLRLSIREMKYTWRRLQFPVWKYLGIPI